MVPLRLLRSERKLNQAAHLIVHRRENPVAEPLRPVFGKNNLRNATA